MADWPKGAMMQDRRRIYLWCCSVAVTLITACVALHNKVEGNWAIAAYPTGIILVADTICRTWSTTKLRIWHIASVVICIALSFVAFFISPTAIALHQPISPLLDRSTEMMGWKTIDARVADEQRIMGGPSKAFVGGINYRMPSQLAFYMPGQPVTYSLFLNIRTSNYMFWEDPNLRIGSNAVIIDDAERPDSLDACRAVFRKVKLAQPIVMTSDAFDSPYRIIMIYRCYDFKGYDYKKWRDGW